MVMLPKKGKEMEETTTRLDITSLWSLCSFSVCKIWSFSKFSVPLIRYTYVYSYQIMAQTTEFSELNRIKEQLSRIERLVDGWNRGGDMPSIERDMALEELRHLYDAILDYRPVEGIGSNEPNLQEHNEFVTPVVPETEEALVVAAAADTYQSLTDEVGDAFDDALDIDALLGLTGDDPIVEEPLIVEPIVAAPLVADPIVEEPATENAAEIIETPTEKDVVVTTEEISVEESEDGAMEESTETMEESTETADEPVKELEKPIGGGLFDMDDIPVRKKGGRRMISLYNEPVTPVVAATTVVESEPTPEPTPTPALMSEPTPAPVSQPTSEPQRLGDVIAKGVKVLGDKMATEEATTPFNRIPEIRRGIGLNDRFLLIRDLFGGDASLYEETITRLDEFDDLDDCMIYIVENFRWNPDSAGARLLVSLIERKLC